MSDSARFILEAAAELFTARGFESTTLQAVGDRAGVAKGLVAHHFGSKHGLLDAVIADFYERQRVELQRMLPAEGTRRERVQGFVSSYFEFMADHHAYTRIIHDMLARDEKVRAIATRHLAGLHGWLANVALGWLPDVGPKSAHHFIVTFSGAVLDYFAYAPGLEDLRPEGMLSDAALEERRAHLRWLVDALMDKLELEIDAAD